MIFKIQQAKQPKGVTRRYRIAGAFFLSPQCACVVPGPSALQGDSLPGEERPASRSGLPHVTSEETGAACELRAPPTLRESGGSSRFSAGLAGAGWSLPPRGSPLGRSEPPMPPDTRRLSRPRSGWARPAQTRRVSSRRTQLHAHPPPLHGAGSCSPPPPESFPPAQPGSRRDGGPF